ncbi:hypothetical protein CR513_27407, partial [Mucuna pruriens]
MTDRKEKAQYRLARRLEKTPNRSPTMSEQRVERKQELIIWAKLGRIPQGHNHMPRKVVLAKGIHSPKAHQPSFQNWARIYKERPSRVGVEVGYELTLPLAFIHIHFNLMNLEGAKKFLHGKLLLIKVEIRVQVSLCDATWDHQSSLASKKIQETQKDARNTKNSKEIKEEDEACNDMKAKERKLKEKTLEAKKIDKQEKLKKGKLNSKEFDVTFNINTFVEYWIVYVSSLHFVLCCNIVRRHSNNRNPQYSEDSHNHLKEFHVECSTMRPHGIPKDYIKIKAFIPLLHGWGCQGLGDMKVMFLEKFFPASRIASTRKEICGVRKHSGETLYEYWERLNKLCATCPCHQINEQLLTQYFYEGLMLMDRRMIDVISGGALIDKTPTTTRNLISNMAGNTQQFGVRESTTSRVVNDDLQTHINQLATIVNQLQSKGAGVVDIVDTNIVEVLITRLKVKNHDHPNLRGKKSFGIVLEVVWKIELMQKMLSMKCRLVLGQDRCRSSLDRDGSDSVSVEHKHGCDRVELDSVSDRRDKVGLDSVHSLNLSQDVILDYQMISKLSILSPCEVHKIRLITHRKTNNEERKKMVKVGMNSPLAQRELDKSSEIFHEHHGCLMRIRTMYPYHLSVEQIGHMKSIITLMTRDEVETGQYGVLHPLRVATHEIRYDTR